MTAKQSAEVGELDPTYPDPLREISQRPERLYLKGRWPLPAAPMFGIVGTRRASSYGLHMAREISRDLARAGAIIVSGMAAGIDAAAHQAALDVGGITVGVLGHGLKWQYPKENKHLYEAMRERATLISEFPYELEPRPALFPQRNRIISGLSRGVVVIEADIKSGALITARFAADQSRDVFAVPGIVSNPMTRGCHLLIKEGAKLVESAEDILQEYEDLFPRHRAVIPSNMAQELGTSGMTVAEIAVFSSLSHIPITVDDLAQVTGLPVDQLAGALLSLELKNRIQALSGQRYAIKN